MPVAESCYWSLVVSRSRQWRHNPAPLFSNITATGPSAGHLRFPARNHQYCIGIRGSSRMRRLVLKTISLILPRANGWNSGRVRQSAHVLTKPAWVYSILRVRSSLIISRSGFRHVNSGGSRVRLLCVRGTAAISRSDGDHSRWCALNVCPSVYLLTSWNRPQSAVTISISRPLQIQ